MDVAPIDELAARRAAIRQEMSAQRKVIERELEPPEEEPTSAHYPRSHTMRFLMRNSHELRKVVRHGVTLMMIAKVFKTSSLVQTLAHLTRTK